MYLYIDALMQDENQRVKPYNQSTLYLHIAGGRLNQTRLEINDGEHFSVNIFKHSMVSS